ncbi:helix-turn-helix transcriptional regulator [Cryptosporangium phraense]|uniref:WYL domain-containing protein n=1 Tax=Cryptosporangium phraense TaxID=2593070 RepID=A0A545AZK4_9ACTN|nr:WYL domain-containing protein [Cryptosporangium phraense]TQS46742.1 WYL domain-containing protein [Cryptosporangium phraense]
MSRRRTERLVNLLLCLLSTRRYLTAAQIAAIVPGYEHDENDPKSHEAFQRMFERDKGELRDLGVPLETGTNSVFDSEPGYRVTRGDYALPEVHLDPEEAAAVGIAARLWHHAELSNAASSGLTKLRAGGVDLADGPPLGIEPVVSADPALTPMLAAIDVRRAVKFGYRTPRDDQPRQRRLQPWGVVSWRGRWYVIGHDLDRNATRCFRLSRVVGTVSAVGPLGAYAPPEGLDLVAQVAAFDPEPTDQKSARVRVRVGAAAGLRRWADAVRPEEEETPELLEADVTGAGAVTLLDDPGAPEAVVPPAAEPDPDADECGEPAPDAKAAWDIVTLSYSDPEALAARLAGYGSAVVVQDPPDVRDAVIRHLTRMAAGIPAPRPGEASTLETRAVGGSR